jgi:hypothetical protein
MKWISIDKLGEYVKGRQMFVVKAFDVVPFERYPGTYTSDPWCVWFEQERGTFERWPHLFMPTHFCLLPEEREE